MGIKIVLLKDNSGQDVFAPVIFCDACNKKIEDYKKAGYMWDRPLTENTVYDVTMDILFFHKGECHSFLEGNLSIDTVKVRLPWEELGMFVLYLSNNIKYDTRQLIAHSQ